MLLIVADIPRGRHPCPPAWACALSHSVLPKPNPNLRILISNPNPNSKPNPRIIIPQTLPVIITISHFSTPFPMPYCTCLSSSLPPPQHQLGHSRSLNLRTMARPLHQPATTLANGQGRCTGVLCSVLDGCQLLKPESIARLTVTC